MVELEPGKGITYQELVRMGEVAGKTGYALCSLATGEDLGCSAPHCDRKSMWCCALLMLPSYADIRDGMDCENCEEPCEKLRRLAEMYTEGELTL